MYNVLVCDDDAAIVNSIEVYLQLEGFGVFKAFNGREAVEIAAENELHCIIMDIMMPEMDGLQATLRLREKNNVPIIMLSAKSQDTDKITGLGFGADDYVTKPFNPLELVARVKSQVRRFMSLGGVSVPTESCIVTGALVLDTRAHEVTVEGEPVKLTATEYKILEYLMINLGRILTTTQIYEAVWNEPSYSTDKTVTVHVRRIREKIELNPKNPKYLKVVWGLGYKIEKI
ncbi:MAG: response regulator transcription factor [Clostridia bacterium]|nr:response regulator transcription factor [Clostridia bacterium]